MGKGGDAVSPSVTSGLSSNSTALGEIATQQNANAQQLYGASFPGFTKAEDFYTALSSGDPYAISRAISPATQQITQAAEGSKANILKTGPAGGEKNLALEEVDVNRGAQVGKTATEGYLGSFNALASLAGQGINQSISSAGTGISGLSASSQGLGELGQLQISDQQMKNEAKGASMGALGSLAGDIFGAAGAAGGGAGAATGFAALFAGL